MTAPTTGWPPSVLMQDDDRRLSRALANTPHARRHAEEAARAINPRAAAMFDGGHLVPIVAYDIDFNTEPQP